MEWLLDILGLQDPALRIAAVKSLTGTAGAVIIAATIGVVSWLANRAWERASENRRRQKEQEKEQRSRQQRRCDLAVALYSEIEANLEMQAPSLDDAQIESIRSRFSRSGESFDPFVFPGLDNAVFDAMISELPLLPARVIRPVVRFYRLDASSNAALFQMNTEVFRDLNNERQLAAVESWNRLAKSVSQAGTAALTALSTYIKELSSDGQIENIEITPVIDEQGRSSL